ncbi:MAG: helix-turn-helix domain-containing protein [Candidatus Veblenbacteria bacterium]|nr:helix-turn-helix domain-containing protein [Candidatus Veblenbacteria bacterium]MDZ4229948.1 helix-turn-helix domain-containing protein [Candidatus Veblenbacteria bacterium]
MARFATQTLRRLNPVGEELEEARLAKHLTLPHLAKRLNIPVQYLTALEAGEWEALPRGDYGRYFLRQYARFLGLDAEKLLQQYPGPNVRHVVQPPRRAPVNPSRAVHPLRRLLLVLVGLGVLAYLAVAARATFLPPQLTLSSPASDGSTTSPMVTVAGVTQTGTEVAVNGEAVEVMESGRFTASVSLRPGFNTLTVTARKSLSGQTTLTRRILFTPPPIASDQPELVP